MGSSLRSGPYITEHLSIVVLFNLGPWMSSSCMPGMVTTLELKVGGRLPSLIPESRLVPEFRLGCDDSPYPRPVMCSSPVCMGVNFK